MPVMEAIDEFPTSCGQVAWDALPKIKELLHACRDAEIPVIYSTSDPDFKAAFGNATKRGVDKTDFEKLAVEFPEMIKPRDNEFIVRKARASAFFGTHLITYLVRKNIDSLLIAGTSTCGCVRGTVLDGYSYGYPVFPVEECIFDRSRTSHLVNLFEMNAKYASVIQLSEALDYVGQDQANGRQKSDRQLDVGDRRSEPASKLQPHQQIGAQLMATESPFADQEYFDRHARAQALMERDGLDALVVSEKNNYWYFSGLISYQLDHIQRPQICILPKTGKPLLLVYGNDKAKAKALPWVGEVRAYTDVPFPQEMIAASIKEMGLGESKLGFELGDDQRLGIPVNYLIRSHRSSTQSANQRRHCRIERDAHHQEPAGNRIHAQGLRDFRQSLRPLPAAVKARHDPPRSRGPALYFDDRGRCPSAPSGIS